MVQSKISFLPSITAPGPAQTKEKVMHAPDSLDSQNSFSGFEDIFQASNVRYGKLSNCVKDSLADVSSQSTSSK